MNNRFTVTSYLVNMFTNTTDRVNNRFTVTSYLVNMFANMSVLSCSLTRLTK